MDFLLEILSEDKLERVRVQMLERYEKFLEFRLRTKLKTTCLCSHVEGILLMGSEFFGAARMTDVSAAVWLNVILPRMSVATATFGSVTFLRYEFCIAIKIILHREESLNDYGRLSSNIPPHAFA